MVEESQGYRRGLVDVEVGVDDVEEDVESVLKTRAGCGTEDGEGEGGAKSQMEVEANMPRGNQCMLSWFSYISEGGEVEGCIHVAEAGMEYE